MCVWGGGGGGGGQCTTIFRHYFNFSVRFLLQCSSENSTQLRISLKQTYAYRVKVVNRAKKSEYSIKRVKYTEKFSSVEDVRTELQSMDVATKDVGYIEPSHGAKGRQMWLETEDDLHEMYQIYDKKRKSEMLWCYMKAEREDDRPIRARKRPLSPTSMSATGSKRTLSAQKLQEVEIIVEKLKEKHAASYGIDAWAHLLHMGKHDSYETPPNLPYFGKGGDSTTGKHKSQKAAQPVSSPSKRRGECIEQLSKWHALLEKGAITEQQYDELKETIMGDLFKLGPT